MLLTRTAIGVSPFRGVGSVAVVSDDEVLAAAGVVVAARLFHWGRILDTRAVG